MKATQWWRTWREWVLSEPDGEHCHYLLRKVLPIMIAMVVPYTFITVVLWMYGRSTATYPIVGLVMLAAYTLILLLNRRQQVRAASWLLVISILVPMLVATGVEGANFANFIGFVAGAVLASVLLPLVVSLGSIVLIMLTYAVADLLHPAQQLGVDNVLTVGIGLFFLLFFNGVSNWERRARVQRERRLSAQLERQNQLLKNAWPSARRPCSKRKRWPTRPTAPRVTFWLR